MRDGVVHRIAGVLAGGLAMSLAAALPVAAKPRLSAEAVEAASFVPLPEPPDRRAVAMVVKAEVWLARAGISPGVIDGIDGDNFRKALSAYQKRSGLPDSGRLDQATWDRLSADKAPVLDRHRITAAEARGPFTRRIPSGFEAQSRLKRLGYHDLKEALAERFHTGVPLLLALNSAGGLRASRDIMVPAVTGGASGKPGSPDTKAARVVVDKTGHAVEAFAADGRLVGFYPASIGSLEKPAPSGQLDIVRVVHRPDYTYDPKYRFKGVKARQPFTIAPGPNNPVGTVWMALSQEGYGLHGTPEPSRIGKTESHGCIRLTNWDAEALARRVDKGTPVFFQDGPADPVAPPPVAPPASAPPPGVPPAPAPVAGTPPASAPAAVVPATP